MMPQTARFSAALGLVVCLPATAAFATTTAADWRAARKIQAQAETGIAQITLSGPSLEDPVSFSGLLFGGQARWAQSRTIEVFAGAGAILEGSAQIAAKMGEVGGVYYVSGGARHADVLTPGGAASFTNSGGIGGIGKLQYASIGVSNPNNPDSNATGALLALAVGVEGFSDFGSWGCYSASALFSPMSFAASQERLAWSGLALSVGWRTAI
jgi:hypothetical protein